MMIAEQWFSHERIDSRVTRLWEPHVARLFQCNIWHVQGRDADLLIDAGMGIASLKTAMAQLLDKPVIAVATHSHMDHVGGLHEFSERLAHPQEAALLGKPEPYPVLCSCHWPEGMRAAIVQQGYEVPDCLINAYPHAHFNPLDFRTPATSATRTVEEGDVIDLGDIAFEVMHLPGHSPGSIGLWQPQSGTFFSGDAVYDGPLLDSLPDASVQDYVRTMQRLRELPVKAVHAGHDPSFGRDRLIELVDQYLASRL